MKPWQNCIDCAAFDKETGSCLKTAIFIPDPSGGVLANEDCFCTVVPRFVLRARAHGYEITNSKTGKRAAFIHAANYDSWEEASMHAYQKCEKMNTHQKGGSR